MAKKVLECTPYYYTLAFVGSNVVVFGAYVIIGLKLQAVMYVGMWRVSWMDTVGCGISQWLPLLSQMVLVHIIGVFGSMRERKLFLWDEAGSCMNKDAESEVESTVFAPNLTGCLPTLLLSSLYGALIARSNSLQRIYLYSSNQFQLCLVFYYLRARYLNTGTGRFWTRDKWEGVQTDPLSLHKYLYVVDDPVNFCDPSGNTYVEQLSVSGIQGILNAMRMTGGALFKRYAMRKIANVGVSAIIGGLYGGALERSGGGDFFGEGMLKGMKWGRFLVLFRSRRGVQI